MTPIWSTVQQGMLERIYTTPGWRPLIEEAYESVPQEWRRYAFQYSTRAANVADKEAAVQLYASAVHGMVAAAEVEIGHEPSPDRDSEGNNAKLADLPHPFAGYFDNRTDAGMMRSDGLVEWTEPLEMKSALMPVTVAPRSVPLEVGFMESPKVVYAMRQTGLARWPYGSKTMLVIVPRTGWQR